MKNSITGLMIFATLLVSMNIKAEVIDLPVISKPSALEEGTQRELSASQIAELLPWAKNSKLFLTELVDSIQGLSTVDKIDRLKDGIEQVVLDSGPKNSEMFMRYSLNRALVIVSILEAEIASEAVGSNDVKLRVLLNSISMAVKYYDQDVRTLTSTTSSDFAGYGISYFRFLTELNKSIFDASAQYTIQRTSLEWLQWDLYRDLNNTSYAPKIVKINTSLKYLPTKKVSDIQYLNYIKQMKRTIEGLEFIEKSVADPSSTKILFETKDMRLKREKDEQDERQRQLSLANYKWFYTNETPGRLTEGCYQVSQQDGRVMWDQGAVSSSNCQSSSFRYYHTNSTPGTLTEGCYPLANNGKTMWTNKAYARSCKSDVYEYFNTNSTPGTLKGGCYQKAVGGLTMWAQGAQDSSNCHSGRSVYYNYNQTPGSMTAGCYAIAKNGLTMWEMGQAGSCQ